MWIGLTAIPKSEHLFPPWSPSLGLLGLISSVAQHLKRLEEESALLSRYLPFTTKEAQMRRITRVEGDPLLKQAGPSGSPVLHRHVLVRSDNYTMTAYVNRQSTVHSSALLVKNL